LRSIGLFAVLFQLGAEQCRAADPGGVTCTTNAGIRQAHHRFAPSVTSWLASAIATITGTTAIGAGAVLAATTMFAVIVVGAAFRLTGVILANRIAAVLSRGTAFAVAAFLICFATGHLTGVVYTDTLLAGFGRPRAAVTLAATVPFETVALAADLA
jgi:hypothetical protein